MLVSGIGRLDGEDASLIQSMLDLGRVGHNIRENLMKIADLEDILDALGNECNCCLQKLGELLGKPLERWLRDCDLWPPEKRSSCLHNGSAVWRHSAAYC